MIRVDGTTSREYIRRSLSGFSFFSKIEVNKDNNAESKTFYIREVGLLEQLSKLFETKDKIKKRDLESKTALLEMALTHPEIAAMLGNSAISKSSWTARQFRQEIDVKQMSLRSLRDGFISNDQNLLITDANIHELKAYPEQSQTTRYGEAKFKGKNFDVSSDTYEVSVSTQWITASQDLKPLYKDMLESSRGIFAMELVPDRSIGKGVPDKFSDQNIDAFLDELDEFEKRHKGEWKKRQIILCAGGNPQLYHRIIDRKLAHDAIKKMDSAKGKLTANDLLKLSAARQSAEIRSATYVDHDTILSVGDENLEATQWNRVHLLNTESPAYVAADRSILSLHSLANTKHPDGTAAPIAALARGVQDSADQFAWEKHHDKSVLQTIALPVDGLPTSELIGFVENLGDDVNRYQEIPAEKYQDFYKNFLKNSKGTVVIECPATSQAYVGLKMALEELESEKSLPKKVVLVASGASFSMARSELGKSDSSSEKI